MEDQFVVEAVAGELAEVLDRLRRVLVVQLDDDRPGIGVEGRLSTSARTLSLSSRAAIDR